MTSLQKVIMSRYNFNDKYPLTKSNLSISPGKLEPMIDSLDSPHQSGFYRKKIGIEMSIDTQYPLVNPPSFFSISTGNIAKNNAQMQSIPEDRNNRFLIAYFSAERQKHRWVHLPEAKAIQLEAADKRFPKNCYYQYDNEGGEKMREYHVDTDRVLINYITDNAKRMGGSLSIRNRPLILVGQDKSTYHQFLFTKKQWKGIEGHHFLLPKSTGKMLMLSGYQSRDFGLELRELLSSKMIELVNEGRKGKDSKSTDDEQIIYSSTKNKDITDDPCL